jgi:NitT/TauT family transport system substrate-binding protein
MTSRAGFIGTTAALALGSGGVARAQSGPPIRVGIGPSDAYGEASYGSDAGIFQNAGLNVEVTGFNSGTTAQAAMLAGQIDIVGTTALPIANAVIRGIPIVLVAAGAVNTAKASQSIMCVRKDGPIRTAQDLIGKTVCFNAIRTGSELALDAYLSKNGIDPTRVRTIEVSVAEMGVAVERGTVDAFVAGEPALSSALRASNVRVFVDPMQYIAPRFMYSAWFAQPSFVERNPDLIKRFAQTMYAVAKWSNTHHTETAAIIAKYTKLDVGDVNRMIRADFSESLRLSELQPLLDQAAKFNYISRPMQASELTLH